MRGSPGGKPGCRCAHPGYGLVGPFSCLTTSRICYLTLYRIYATKRISLAHRGASPETVPLAEQGVASRGEGSYPQPREVRDPVRQALRPGREELAARIRRKCRRWKHGPRPKIATVERREARVPRWGREAPRKRLACRVMSTPGCRVKAPRVSRRSATPRRVVKEVSNPGRTASRERDRLFDIVKKRVRSASPTPGQEQCATAGPLPCDAGAIPPESGPLAVQASEERNSGPRQRRRLRTDKGVG